ncbi:MAG TPA: NAD-dependent epimerase/dehydratase family protein, partial [Myxococcales bacterium]|nr:NAD-dependent epimerase/dehydratase family protein [Myxococcales bacterium]
MIAISTEAPGLLSLPPYVKLPTSVCGPVVYGCRMRVLVTGGSGFLGSYVAEQLAAEGHVVRALVRPA